MRPHLSSLALAALLLASPPLPAQQIRLDDATPAAPRQPEHVSFDPEPLTVHAAKPDWVEVRFHIAPGFHINSHTPHDELLIPTTLQLSPAPHLHILADAYPSGMPLQLATGSAEILSVYQGELRVRLQVVADKGDTTLTGVLHYQACDAASCFPPRNLPFSLPLSAR